MSNVTLLIGGRNYTVACATGEEAHVAGLGRLIDVKLATMGVAAGQAEARSLLFAALLLADELHETRGQLQSAPAQSAPAQSPPAQGEANAATEAELVSALEDFAERIENLAARLEG